MYSSATGAPVIQAVASRMSSSMLRARSRCAVTQPAKRLERDVLRCGLLGIGHAALKDAGDHAGRTEVFTQDGVVAGGLRERGEQRGQEGVFERGSNFLVAAGERFCGPGNRHVFASSSGR